ncbi:MAG TPA: glycosyltransferase family A protein [Solirubrobacteraceae bacterium]
MQRAMTARVAVVIPCYNDGATLAAAVQSVRESEPIEVVVVNDGSSDPGTLLELQRLRGAGVHVIDRENGGLSAARMTGVAATAPPYIYPLDADDCLQAGALQALLDALERAPRAAFAYGDYEVFGEYRGRWHSPERFDPWAMTYANFIPVSSLIRRSALEQVGGWELHNAVEDWDLWLKMVERGWDGVRVPRVVYRRRVHGESLISDTRRRHGEMVGRLRARHRELFASRRRLAARSRPGLTKRLSYPLLFGLRNRNLIPGALESRVLRLGLERSLRRAQREAGDPIGA